MNDLDLLKNIADIEGITLTYSNNLGAWSSGTPYGKDDFEYDPLTSKALLFDLMVKYKVEVSWWAEGSGCVFIDNDVYNNTFEFVSISKLPRAILECIVEANKV